MKDEILTYAECRVLLKLSEADFQIIMKDTNIPKTYLIEGDDDSVRFIRSEIIKWVISF